MKNGKIEGEAALSMAAHTHGFINLFTGQLESTITEDMSKDDVERIKGIVKRMRDSAAAVIEQHKSTYFNSIEESEQKSA